MVDIACVRKGDDEGLTVPLWMVWRHVAKASQARNKVISWTSVFVSRASVVSERNWESLARRQGCLEMWMMVGRGTEAICEKRNWIWRGKRSDGGDLVNRLPGGADCA